jgi:hypothetical protein
MLHTRWDHTSKPSKFLVYEDDKVIFEGPYNEGIQLFVDSIKKKSDTKPAVEDVAEQDVRYGKTERV